MSTTNERVRDLRHRATLAEKLAWDLLRDRRFLGLKFRRQHPIGNFIVDFYCEELKLAIELDGSVHAQPSQVRRDAVRDVRLGKLGVMLFRLPNGIVLQDPEAFLDKIRHGDRLTRRFAPPSPERRGRKRRVNSA